MNTLRKSFRKRYREPNLARDDFQDGFHTFQHRSKKRESVRRRQAPPNLMPKDIEAALEREANVINASTKLLNACTNPIQQLEISKTIILSKTRMNRLKSPQTEKRSANSLGNVYLSELRIPLAWNLDDLINPKVTTHYAMFAMVSCDGMVFDTELAANINSESSEVSFDEAIVFANVPPDFQVDIELYSCEVTHKSSKDRPFNKLKSFLEGVKGKSKPHSSLRQHQAQNPAQFTCIARARLGLRDVCVVQHNQRATAANSHVWCIQGGGDEASPPLYDYFSFKLTAKPCYRSMSASVASRVAVSWSDSDIVVSNCHVRFSDMTVKLWMSEGRHEKGCEPWKEITLAGNTQITIPTSQVEGIAANTFALTWNESDTSSITLSFKSEDDCDLFEASMRSQLESYLAWNVFETVEGETAAAARMDLLSPLSTAGGGGCQSPPRYRRYLQNRSQSRLLVMYNQISGINILAK